MQTNDPPCHPRLHSALAITLPLKGAIEEREGRDAQATLTSSGSRPPGIVSSDRRGKGKAHWPQTTHTWDTAAGIKVHEEIGVDASSAVVDIDVSTVVITVDISQQLNKKSTIEISYYRRHKVTSVGRYYDLAKCNNLPKDTLRSFTNVQNYGYQNYNFPITNYTQNISTPLFSYSDTAPSCCDDVRSTPTLENLSATKKTGGNCTCNTKKVASDESVINDNPGEWIINDFTRDYVAVCYEPGGSVDIMK
ncbi:hypothetical protein FQA39_LY00721 [Lamprigera yunnana]|nr:hypothetical protein FQA39_LY00721 [Lamprigera yunnana]